MASIRVNRAELLQSLQAVQPGLTTKDVIEQSSCVVFRDNEVVTFNEEIACRAKTPIKVPDFKGAIPANPLIKILGKMEEEEIEIELSENEFLIVGKKRKTGIRIEVEITLPIDSAEKPGKVWTPLHENFVEAIATVQECAGKDTSQFALTCVHIHPKWIEAFDNTHLARFKIKTGVGQECLVKRDYLKHIINLEMKEFNETETWIHFRNAAGLVLSCRRYIEDFIDLKPMINFKGESMQLPPGLADAADRAEVFSEENKDSNQLRIDLKSGKLRIKGTGNTGWYSEVKSLKYNGPDLCFYISPKLLKMLVKKHHECEVTADKMKVNGGNYVYVVSLLLPKEVDGKISKTEDE